MSRAHCHNSHQVSAKTLSLYRIPRGTVVACYLPDGHTGMCKATIADSIILFGGHDVPEDPRSYVQVPDRNGSHHGGDGPDARGPDVGEAP